MTRMTEEAYAARQAKNRPAKDGMSLKQYAHKVDAQCALAAQKQPVRVAKSYPAPAHSKYLNRPTGGYSSAKEARRAQELKLMEKAGTIRNLREQVRFVLIPKQGKERACEYVSDFCYAERNALWPNEWIEIVEDVKSEATRKLPAYVIKRKLLLWVHGITLKQT